MVNPNIFAQFAAPRSIADYQGDAQRREANALTLDGVRRKNAMEDMALQKSQAKQNALMQIAQGWTPQTTVQERVASLRSNPELWGEADALEKADLDRQKTSAEVGDKNAGTAEKLMKIRKAAIGMVVANPTPEALEAVMADLEAITGVPAAQGRALFQGATTPEAIKERAMRIGIELDKQMPTMQTNDAGGFVSGVAIDPLTGKPIAGAGFTTQKTQSPDNAATNARAAADAAAGRAVTMRGQNLVDGRARERLAIDNGTDVADAGGPSQAAFTKRFGKAPAGYRWKADGSMESIPGGPTDRKSNEQLAGKETVDNVVAGLRSAYDALNTNDGITSTGKGALTNIGAAVSRSGVGQIIGGALGSKNQKERDSIAQARPLLLQAIMKATGMSAKQMDSNAELKLYLATATDPTLTLEANREALDRIEQLYGSGALTAKPNTGGATGSWGDKPAGNVVDFGSLK